MQTPSHNRGQRSTREASRPDGDGCDWWALDDAATTCELAAQADLRFAERGRPSWSAVSDQPLVMRVAVVGATGLFFCT